VKLESLSWAPEGKHGTEETAWMAVTLARDGIITSISETSEPLIGYQSREVIGRPVTCLLADRSVFEVSRILETAREWGFWSGQITYRDSAGTSLNGSCTLLALSGESPQRAGFLMFSAFEGASAGTEYSDVAGIGGRLRSFAHEMNNPLAVIMGMAQLMLLNPQLQGRIRSDMEKLYAEMQRVIHVTERLHSYAISLQQEEETRHANVG
jgi:signal transduction histidine kinase